MRFDEDTSIKFSLSWRLGKESFSGFMISNALGWSWIYMVTYEGRVFIYLFAMVPCRGQRTAQIHFQYGSPGDLTLVRQAGFYLLSHLLDQGRVFSNLH